MWKWILLAVIVIAVIGMAAVTFYVEREAPFGKEALATGSRGKALILYHPSRDAHFSDDLTLALARGFEDAGFSVERWTMASDAPGRPEGYDVIAVVSNTFYMRPDWPTMRYLKRADLGGRPVVAIMAGAGSTEAASRKLGEALRRANAGPTQVRSLWISRPNDPARPGEDNRAVAGLIARQLAKEVGEAAVAREAGKQPDQAAAFSISQTILVSMGDRT